MATGPKVDWYNNMFNPVGLWESLLLLDMFQMYQKTYVKKLEPLELYHRSFVVQIFCFIILAAICSWDMKARKHIIYSCWYCRLYQRLNWAYFRVILWKSKISQIKDITMLFCKNLCDLVMKKRVRSQQANRRSWGTLIKVLNFILGCYEWHDLKMPSYSP